MINITKLCNKFNQSSEIKKLPAHFTAKKCCRQLYHQIKVTKGVTGATLIPDQLLPEFLSWLSTDFHDRILNGELANSLLKELE